MAAGACAPSSPPRLARSRHRLGRCRPRRPGRRAEGREPADQRIGRANHRLDEPSPRHPGAGQPLRGAGMPRRARRRRRSARRTRQPAAGRARRAGAARPGHGLRRPVRRRRALRRGAHGAAALRGLTARLRRVVELRRHRRLCAPHLRALTPDPAPEGRAVARRHPRVAQQYRMNIGTIVEATMLKVRLVRGRGRGRRRALHRAVARRPVLGEIEEYFARGADAGRHVPVRRPRCCAFEGIRENEAVRGERAGATTEGPSYAGGKFPLSTYLADRVRAMLADPDALGGAARPGPRLAGPAALTLGRCRAPTTCWSRPFRAGRALSGRLPFEGRLAHQTLGMLLTRRLERPGWSRSASSPPTTRSPSGAWTCRSTSCGVIAALRRGHAGRRSRGLAGGIGDAEAHLPQCAVIAGLIERRHPGRRRPAAR
jgi:ATP-dependent Lhr-like helicase